MATIVSTIGSAVILLWPAQIMALLFGPEYAAASGVLCVLTIGQLVNVAFGPCLNFMLIVGRRGLATVIVVLSGAAAILLSFALIGQYGIEGVAIGCAVGMGLQNGSLYLASKKISRISTSTFITPVKIYQTMAMISMKKLRKVDE